MRVFGFRVQGSGAEVVRSEGLGAPSPETLKKSLKALKPQSLNTRNSRRSPPAVGGRRFSPSGTRSPRHHFWSLTKVNTLNAKAKRLGSFAWEGTEPQKGGLGVSSEQNRPCPPCDELP